MDMDVYHNMYVYTDVYSDMDLYSQISVFSFSAQRRRQIMGIMGTCASKLTFLDQKRAEFPNFGAQNSTVTFISWKEASKDHKKATKITNALLKSNSCPGQSRAVHVR